MDRPKKTEAVESKEDAYPVQGTPLVHQADDSWASNAHSRTIYGEPSPVPLRYPKTSPEPECPKTAKIGHMREAFRKSKPRH